MRWAMTGRFGGVPRSLVAGLIVAAMGVGLAWGLLPPGFLDRDPAIIDAGEFRNNFARRWGGGCNGWTRDVALFHLIAHVSTFIAYMIASFAILIGHPHS